MPLPASPPSLPGTPDETRCRPQGLLRTHQTECHLRAVLRQQQQRHPAQAPQHGGQGLRLPLTPCSTACCCYLTRLVWPPSRGRKPSYAIVAQMGATGGPDFPWPLPAKILVLSQPLYPLLGVCGLLPAPFCSPKHRLNARGILELCRLRGLGSALTTHMKEDRSLAISSPEWTILDGLRRRWSVKLADLGSAPFTAAGGGGVSRYNRHAHLDQCIAVLCCGVSLLEID